MMTRLIFLSLGILSILILPSCAVLQKTGQEIGVEYKPKLEHISLQKEFDSIPPPANGKITVAVYNFRDLTGQRKPSATYASFSTAVTQGAELFLIKALQEVGYGTWFDVVERTSVDDLIKERTIIKQMREAYEGKNSQQLPPMQFAGIIMEGGIIGYDSSIESGGAGYQWLGIGPQTQYSKDVVTVSLRAVSVATGKVLVSVSVTKIIYSTADSIAVLKSWQQGTQIFMAETGLTINEPVSLAVKTTIEAAVVELINEGKHKGVWSFATPVQQEE
jgi:curli production assembly/transport component CsgG